MPSYGPSPAAVPGRFNVYVPNLATSYISFDTLAEAQADVTAHNMGVVLDQAGQLDPAQQVWSGWQSYQSQFVAAATATGGVNLNPSAAGAAPATGTNGAIPNVAAQAAQVSTKPAAGRPSVFIPNGYAAPGVTAGSYPNGAYLIFGTAAEAQAFATQNNVGVVLDSNGKYDATQPWPSAPSYQATIHNGRLTPTQGQGKFAVWFPSAVISSLGLGDTSQLTNGAYVTFDTEAEAAAQVNLVGYGVVVDASGAPVATQPWYQASTYGAQLLNSQLQTAPVRNQFNVWFPPANVNNLGLSDSSPYTTTGAYLGFATEAEAAAHIMARGDIGIAFDPKGQLAATQPAGTGSAAPYVNQLYGSALTAQPTSGEFNVWVPQSNLGNIGVSNTAAYPGGAYLAFDTEAEAQAHLSATYYGIALDQSGTPTATQPWPQASQFTAQLFNSQMTAQRTPNKFSAYFPPAYLTYVGVSDPTPFPNGAYIAFATEAEASAHVTNMRSGYGAVLDQNGNFTATQPGYGFAQQSVFALFGSALTAQPPSNKCSVWVPQNALGNIGVTNTASYPNGAYLAFNTEAEAVAHATATQWGIVLNNKGKLAATQPWPNASQYTAQLFNSQLSAQRTPNEFSVYFPPAWLNYVGVSDPTPYPNGAYLAFDTEAEAQAHVALRSNYGVVLDQQGDLAATQPGAATGIVGQSLFGLYGKRFTAQQAANTFSAWVPPSYLTNIGVTNTASFTGGAYLAFNSEAEAAAFAASTQACVVLDAQGKPAAVQPWASAGQFTMQLYNSLMAATPTPNKFAAWVPAAYLTYLGQNNTAAFPNGAFVPFDTEAEAISVAKQLQYAAVIDQNGALDAIQPTPNIASLAAGNPAIKPAPPSGWVSAPTTTDATVAAQLGSPTAGSIAIGTVTPTSKGADVEVHVGSLQGNDTVQFSVGGQLAGNWTPIFTIPDMVQLPATGWTTYTLHIDYSKIDTYLHTVDPNLSVTPDMASAIGLQFYINGGLAHDTGLPSWAGNNGTEKAALFNLPAPSGV